LINIFSFVFVFVIIIDPPNTLLGFKNIAFGLLLLVCLFSYKTTWKPAWSIIAIVYAIISVSVLMGYLQGFTFDIQMIKLIYKTYVLLFLLLWIDKLSLLEKMFFPAIIIAGTVITVYGIITFYPSTTQSIYQFFTIKYDLIWINKRTFIGMDFLSIYYKSIALLIIPFAFYLYKVLFKDKNKLKNCSLSIVFFIALLFSGTRACMFSGIFLVALMIIMRIYKSKIGKLLAPVMGSVILIYSCSIIHQVLNDREEISLKIRSGHINSYKKLIGEHPLILVLGEGAGSKFYSDGFGEETVQTEWSYAELIRWFGLFGAGIIILIYVFPLYVLYRKRKILPYSLPIQIGYSFYLFIAGTNPLLLGSTGLITLLIIYNYAFNHKYEQHEK
jgi:hypothetical protein